MIKKLFYVFSATSLIGCSYFSPNYVKPSVATPSSWSTAQSFESINQNLPYLAWWQKFHDPDLNSYIESGLQNNHDIQVAKANLEAAQGQLLAAKLNWIPFVSLFGGAINGTSQNNLAPIGNLGMIGSGSFFAILPAYTVNLFTNYTVQKQAGYNVDAAKNAELSVRLAVIGQVSAAYFAFLAQEQLVGQYKDVNKTIEELLQITKSLSTRGLTNGISVEELRSKQQLLVGQIAIAEHNLQLAKNALRLLINQTPGNVGVGGKFKNINPNQIIPGVMPVTVIAARPDILQAEDRLKAANEGISVVSSALLPSVNLNYFYAQGSGNQTFNNPVPDVGFNNGNTQNYYAAYANWTISPAIFGQINTSSAIFRASLANYKYVVNLALHEVDNALSANNSWAKKLSSDMSASNELESSVHTKEAMYNHGLLPYGAVLMARAEQQILAIDVTQTKLQQLISLVNVYQSLGGGYSYNFESNNKESSK